jgi:hypothetical protein
MQIARKSFLSTAIITHPGIALFDVVFGAEVMRCPNLKTYPPKPKLLRTNSVVGDFQELHRFLIGDFVIRYCQNLAKRDFMCKAEKPSGQEKGKREYLNDVETKDFTSKLNTYFETTVEIPRIEVGNRQTFETLINQEALLFAKYLRNEREEWVPRIGIFA